MELPTEWTYDGLLDWSSKDKLKLTPAGLALRCIRAALNERLGLETDARTLTELYPLYIMLDKDITFSIGQDMQKALYGYTWDQEEKVIQWADYRNEESWEGAASIDNVAPAFTEETLLDAIGEEELLPVPDRLAVLTPDWIYQQYKILNAMRYQCCTKEQSTSSIIVQAYGTSWADVENDYRNDPSVGYADMTYISSAYYDWSNSYSMTRSSFGYSAGCHSIPKAYFKWYVKAVAVEEGNFDAQGYNVSEGVFSLIHTGTEKGSNTFSIQDPDLSNPPPGRPASGLAGWRLASPWWEVNDYKPVAFFDFQFKDW